MMSLRRAAAIVGGVTLITVHAPASARDWPSAGGWETGEASESCGMTQTYEGKGETALTLILMTDGRVGIQISNSNWSAKAGQSYETSWQVNGSVYTGKAAGVREAIGGGFVATFGSEFLEDFAKGSSLVIRTGDTLIDNLSLAGSAAGLAVVQRCLRAVKADQAAVARERARFAHIPDDPFANAVGEPSLLKPSIAAGWVSADDYPPSALRAREEGTTRIRFRVDDTGRVAQCDIIQSSGSKALDDATCRAVSRRGRVAAGQPQSVEHSVVWKLPS